MCNLRMKLLVVQSPSAVHIPPTLPTFPPWARWFVTMSVTSTLKTRSTCISRQAKCACVMIHPGLVPACNTPPRHREHTPALPHPATGSMSPALPHRATGSISLQQAACAASHILLGMAWHLSASPSLSFAVSGPCCTCAMCFVCTAVE